MVKPITRSRKAQRSNYHFVTSELVTLYLQSGQPSSSKGHFSRTTNSLAFLSALSRTACPIDDLPKSNCSGAQPGKREDNGFCYRQDKFVSG